MNLTQNLSVKSNVELSIFKELACLTALGKCFIVSLLGS